MPPPTHPEHPGLREGRPGAGPYLAPVGVLHDEAQAVVGLEGVLQGLQEKQSWNPALGWAGRLPCGVGDPPAAPKATPEDQQLQVQ